MAYRWGEDGTAVHYRLVIAGGASVAVRLRLRPGQAAVRGHRMKRLLARMLDETEFLSDYGIRAVSKHHERNPFVFEQRGNRFGIAYVPGESTSNLSLASRY